MLARMVSNVGPRDLPALASQSGGITGVSHRVWPGLFILSQGLNSSPLLDTSEVFKKSSHQLQLTFEGQI